MSGDTIAWIKFALTVLGAGLLAGAQAVEPSEAVWITAFAGGMLGAAVDEDRLIRTILIRAAIGVVAGISAGILADSMFHVPRPPVALFVGLFAARLTIAINRDIDQDWRSVVGWGLFRRRT